MSRESKAVTHKPAAEKKFREAYRRALVAVCTARDAFRAAGGTEEEISRMEDEIDLRILKSFQRNPSMLEWPGYGLYWFGCFVVGLIVVAGATVGIARILDGGH